MNEVVELLKSIDRRLATIEMVIAKPDLSEVLVKGDYTTEEVAALTQQYGTKKAENFTVRLACNDRRIPEAFKNESGFWRIPRPAVMKIMQSGIPPERRKPK